MINFKKVMFDCSSTNGAILLDYQSHPVIKANLSD